MKLSEKNPNEALEHFSGSPLNDSLLLQRNATILLYFFSEHIIEDLFMLKIIEESSINS